MLRIEILYIILCVLFGTLRYFRSKKSKSYITAINETGNIVIQIINNKDFKQINRYTWNQEIGKFLLLLYLIDKTYGLRSANRSQYLKVISACPWLTSSQKPIHYRKIVKYQFAIDYVTRILYSEQTPPYRQASVQRMLITMIRTAFDMIDNRHYAEEHLTIAIIKTIQKKKGFYSRIYLFSLDIKTIAKLGSWLKGEATDHQRILINIKEESFSFKKRPNSPHH